MNFAKLITLAFFFFVLRQEVNVQLKKNSKQRKATFLSICHPMPLV